MSAKSKSVSLSFSLRQLQISQELIASVIVEMAEKRQVAINPAEIAFYDEQTKRYEDLSKLLQPNAGTKKSVTRKIRLTEEQFHMLSGSLAHRNRLTLVALHNQPDSAEKVAGLDAYTEWEAFSRQLERKDPRQHDHSQDAEPDEEEESEEEEVSGE